MVYFALIHSNLNYGIEINANTYNSYLNKLMILNNKILRSLQSAPRYTHVKDLYSKYNTSTIPNLHKYNILLFAHKFFHHPYLLPDIFVSYFTINSEYHGYSTRSKGDPHLELFTSSLGQRSLKYKGPRLWCSLPDQLKVISSTHSFKHKLKIYLQNRQDL